MSGWQIIRLGDICSQVTSGGTPLRSVREYYDGGTIPWLKTGEVKKGYVWEVDEHITERGLKESSAKLIPVNSLIVAMYGDGNTAGNVAINKVPLATNQACCNFTLNPKSADFRYVYHYLKASYSNLVGLKLGGSQQNLNAATLKSFPIHLPSLATQQKIAAVLSAYDDLIANNQRRITLLERMAEDIYREWFVRLRFPGHESAKIEKGVPQGWKPLRFGQFCVLKRGYDLPDADIEPGPYPVIASTSIKAHHKTFKVLPPVITTGRSGSLGDVLYTNAKAWPLNTALYVKDFCGNSPFLVFYTLKNMGLENFNAGAGVPSLNRNHLNGIPIAVPSAVLQAAFDAKLSPIFQLKEKLFKQTETLKATRDALLPRLISGKLSVDALDIHFSPGMQQQGM